MTEHLRDMEERPRNSNILPIEAVPGKVRNRENKRKEGGKEVLRTEKKFYGKLYTEDPARKQKINQPVNLPHGYLQCVMLPKRNDCL